MGAFRPLTLQVVLTLFFICSSVSFWWIVSLPPSSSNAPNFCSLEESQNLEKHYTIGNGNSISLSFPRLRIAIVMPFVWSQMNLLLANLASWDRFHPCIVSNADLVFYPSQIGPEYNDLQTKILEVMEKSNARACFKQIYFQSALVLPERDVYGVGVLDQVYHLFNESKIRLKSNYNYIFYMEPDSRPIRHGWLDAVYVETIKSHPFWTKGSPPRYIYDQNAGDVPHINGNALYRFDDSEMKKHFLQSRGAFKNYASFDQSWAVHLASASLLHNYIYSDFILNNPSFDVASFSDNTVIVHGKVFAKQLEKLLGTRANLDVQPINHHANKDIG